MSPAREFGSNFVAAWAANAAALAGTYDAGMAAPKAVWHRGAVDADGKTGDGAGIHIEIPQDFFADENHRGFDRLRPGPINVGCIGKKANATRPETEQIMLSQRATPGKRSAAGEYWFALLQERCHRFPVVFSGVGQCLHRRGHF